MDGFSRISKFLSDECDYDDYIDPDEDIFSRVGITGDDADDFMIAFEKTFDVDMRNYLWYFHCEEEGGLDLGGLFFKSPDRLVTRIPITPRVLSDSIAAKEWAVQYPEHTMPKVRRDLALNWVLLLAAPLLFLIWTVVRFDAGSRHAEVFRPQPCHLAIFFVTSGRRRSWGGSLAVPR